MGDLVKELADRGLALPPEDRSRLIDTLLASLNEASLGELDPAWENVVAERLAEYARGELQAVDAAEIFARRLT